MTPTLRLARYPFRAMGSPCELRLYASAQADADAAAEAGMAEVSRLERKYTRYRDDSLTSAINRSAGDPGGVDVDEETAGLLDYADTAFAQSGGLFDITSGVLRRAWNFKACTLPSREQVEAARSLVGWQRVDWRRPRVSLPKTGMELDFGGYVKEYAADRVAELCRVRGIQHGLVDLGGDLCVIGPHPDGSPWLVGIRHPRRPRAALATLPLFAGGVASSGDYERCMVVDGKRYAHILDPRTGWPVAGLIQVSVVSRHCLIAGTASTTAMLKGPREGIRWLDDLGLPNLRMDRDGSVSGTLGQAAGAAADASSVRP